MHSFPVGQYETPDDLGKEFDFNHLALQTAELFLTINVIEPDLAIELRSSSGKQQPVRILRY